MGQNLANAITKENEQLTAADFGILNIHRLRE
jgi:hypothetical protein